MKKLVLLFSAVLIAFVFVGCTETTTEATTTATTTAATTAGPTYIAAPYSLEDGETVDSQFLDPVYYENENGPTIGVTLLGVIELDGMYFRDLNNNHELDVFEDWRVDADTRAWAMAESLSDTQLSYNLLNNMFYAPSVGTLEAAVDENGDPVWENIYGSDSVEGWNYQKYRQFVVRMNTGSTEVMVWFNNGLEQYAEWDAIQRGETAVPFLAFTNPIGHGMPSSEGMTAAALGDGNADDILLDSQYDGDLMWAKGIDGIYGPQIDLVTDPRWSRNGTTYGERVWMAEEIARNLVIGYQDGDQGMVPGSVLLTIKHFPGDGASYNGFESHGNTGRYRVYQTENSFANYQLKPFIAGFEAGAAGVMPGYSMPSDDGRNAAQSITYNGQTYDILYGGYGNAFNADMTYLLREILGFEGLINSDSISDGNAHGVNEFGDNLTPLEQTVLFVQNCDSGVFAAAGSMGAGMGVRPELIKEALDRDLIERDVLERAAYYRIQPRILTGDLDNPYRDLDESVAKVNEVTPLLEALVEQVNLKSVVLLKNSGDVLPLVDTSDSIYVGGYGASAGGWGPPTPISVDGLKAEFGDLGFNVVDDYNTADVVYLRLQPSLGGGGASGALAVIDLGEDFETPLYDEVAQPTGETTFVTTVPNMAEFQTIADAVHANGGIVIGDIVASSPWILTEMEPYCDALVATFGTSDSAVGAVITGEYAPTGKLPITMVADASVIALVDVVIDDQPWQDCVSPNDVPGYDKEQYMDQAILDASPSGSYAYKDEDGNYYWSEFGLTYND